MIKLRPMPDILESAKRIQKRHLTRNNSGRGKSKKLTSPSDNPRKWSIILLAM